MAIQGCVLAFSQFYIPLPVVHTIGSSGVIFIFIIDYYLNGVKVNRKQIMGIIIGIIGLILTVNGRLIITYFNP